MHYPFLIIVKNLHVRGMALFPFILLREKSFSQDKIIMNHELIHHQQQLELLIIPFYIFYVINYFFNRFKYKTHDTAYRNIIFEREAYAKENDFAYRGQRRIFSFLKYL